MSSAAVQSLPTRSKPLSVQVAEAIGWTQIEPPGYVSPIALGGYTFKTWTGVMPGTSERVSIWQYDENWSSAGPLIEKYHIYLGPVNEESVYPGCRWFSSIRNERAVHADSPLEAVCRLIVALHEAGKL